MIACREGHERLAQELLKANADVNAASKVRYTSYSFTCMCFEVSFLPIKHSSCKELCIPVRTGGLSKSV